MKSTIAGILLITIILTTLTLQADNHDMARSLRQAGDILSLEQIMQMLPKADNARIIETELEQENGRWVYEIERLEMNGHVYGYSFDAVTGELLERELED